MSLILNAIRNKLPQRRRHLATAAAARRLKAVERSEIPTGRDTPHSAYRPPFRNPQSALRTGFTLVEVLLALAICAIVLVAINAVFASAVRLRDHTSSAVERSLPANAAMDKLRKDLRSVVGPFGFLAGDFKCDSPTMGQNMGVSSSSGSGLDFFAATGVIGDDSPWGDIQEVFYQLVPASDRTKSLGLDFVRCVNRNLLATTTQNPDTQVLMTDVQSVEFECFDGLEWRETWDTSAGDTNLPTAVRIRIHPAADANAGMSKPEPYEMMVPLVNQTLTTNVIQGTTAPTTGFGP